MQPNNSAAIPNKLVRIANCNIFWCSYDIGMNTNIKQTSNIQINKIQGSRRNLKYPNKIYNLKYQVYIYIFKYKNKIYKEEQKIIINKIQEDTSFVDLAIYLKPIIKRQMLVNIINKTISKIIN